MAYRKTPLGTLKRFLRKHKIETIDFNPQWIHWACIYDRIVDGPLAPKLAPGQHVQTVATDGRIIFISGYKTGNLVIGQKDRLGLTYHAPIGLDMTSFGQYYTGQVTVDNVDRLLKEVYEKRLKTVATCKYSAD